MNSQVLRQGESDPSGAPPQPRTAERSINRPDWQSRTVCFSLVLLTLCVYRQVAGFGFGAYDDDSYIVNNPFVRQGLSREGVWLAFTSSWAANWHPLTWISHMADCALFGVTPGPAHFENAVLHALAAVLLFKAMQALTGTFWRSAAVAGIFAAHPQHVESVAWIAERKDVLSGVFFMLTLRAYAVYAHQPSARKLGMVCLNLALGLMAKPTLVTLPCLLFLLDVWPLRRRLSAHLLWEKIPLFALSAISSLLTLHAQATAKVPLESLPLRLRLANALVSYLAYVEQFLAPANLAPFYPHPLHGWPPGVAWGCAAALLAISLASLLALRRFPFFFAGWFWYLGTLVPMIGLVQVGGQSRADRYMYLSQIGMSIIVAWTAAALASRLRGPLRFAPPMAVAGWILCLAAIASRQTALWQSDAILWQHALDATGSNPVARNILGTVFFNAGRMDEAAAQYRKSVEETPTYSMCYNNLASALRSQGKTREAEAFYKQAFLVQELPLYRLNLARLLFELNRKPEAFELLKDAVKRFPNDPDLLTWLGLVYCDAGLQTEAQEVLKRALELQPGNAMAECQLGNLLLASGQVKPALVQLLQCERDHPDFPLVHFALGNAWLHVNGMQPAMEQFKKALNLKRDYLEARKKLAELLVCNGRAAEAVPHLRKILQAAPADSDAAAMMASALIRTGSREAAIALAASDIAGNAALVKSVRDPGTLWAVALARERAGNPAEAQEELREALKLAKEWQDSEVSTGVQTDLQRLESAPAAAPALAPRTNP